MPRPESFEAEDKPTDFLVLRVPVWRGCSRRCGLRDAWVSNLPEEKRHAKNWELHRIAAVDRNILRLAIYEMLHRQDIPPVVSINEAVDIAKKFSTQDSGKFVNGILDNIHKELVQQGKMHKVDFRKT